MIDTDRAERAVSDVVAVEYFADERPSRPSVQPREFHHGDGSFKRRESRHEYRQRKTAMSEGHRRKLQAHEHEEEEKWRAFRALLEGRQ